jgi:peptide deformylase
MAVREILKMGDARLLQSARQVEAFGTPALHALIADLKDTMAAAQGVGLAAPQIGVDLAVVIFGFGRSQRYLDESAVPETALLNPVIHPLSCEEEDGWEGCLSVPGLRGVLPRWRRIRYSGVDPWGSPLTARPKASMRAWSSTNATT